MPFETSRSDAVGAQPSARSPAGPAWALLAIAVAVTLAYSTSFWHPFIFDDFGAIARNSTIRDLRSPRLVMAPPSESPVAGRPLVNLSFAINYAIGGLDVRGYHIGNLALHVLCAFLVFGLVRRTLEWPAQSAAVGRRSWGVALAVALLWAVHPLVSEVVDYLTERTESMMALCYLATLYASLRALDATRRGRWQAAAVVACAFGMACKESMVTAPLMVALYDRIFVFDSMSKAWRNRWRLYAALAATWIILAILMASSPRTSSGGFATAPTSVWVYLLNQFVMVTRYLRLAIWPQSLVLYYGWPQPLTVADVWPYALLLASLVAIAVVISIGRPRFGFLVAWVIVTLAPSSSIVPIGSEVGAERRMYLPLIALVAMAVSGGVVLLDRLDRPSPRGGGSLGRRATATPIVALVVLVFFTAGLGASTFARTEEYASGLMMARTVLARWPSPAAEYQVGTELATAGRHDEAISHLRSAAEGMPPARYNLGSELFVAGRYAESIAELKTFVRDEPGLDSTTAARLLMGRAFEATGRWPEAIAEFQTGVAASPGDADAQGLLAVALGSTRAFEEAVGHYRAFLAARPADAAGWTGLGISLAATSRTREAIAAFRQAAVLDPHNGRFQENLARALLDDGEIAEAVVEAQRAATLAPGDPAAYEVLGRALTSAGRIGEARRAFEAALRIDRSYTPALEGLKRIGGE
jgi:tetratricopeptide (TPR) repeat protein